MSDMRTMGFLAHFTIFVLVVHGLSNVALHRLETPGFDQRAPGTSEERQGKSTQNPPGDSAGTQQLVEAEQNVRGYDERLVHSRSKRDLIVPGTKWCGAGNSAANYDDLGVNQETDMCCRDHDHCPVNIRGGATRYAMRNWLPYTRSGCDCDDSFRSCLRAVNNDNSNLLGYLFFNVLYIPCFTLSNDRKRRCVERSWYGSCLEYEDYYELTAHTGPDLSY